MPDDLSLDANDILILKLQIVNWNWIDNVDKNSFFLIIEQIAV